MRASASSQRGFTLIELIVAMVALAIVLAALATLVYPTMKRNPEALIQIRAVELGQAYLDEILTKRYDEISQQGGVRPCSAANPGLPNCSAVLGPEEGSRASYDDVDDYNGLNESPPRDALDNARSTYGNYRVQVAVSYAGTDLPGTGGAEDAKRITVTVSSPLGDDFVFAAYRLNF